METKPAGPQLESLTQGYSGSKWEGQAPPTRPGGASANATVNYYGATEPTKSYYGDGVTQKPLGS
jgi:hypothetical protein